MKFRNGVIVLALLFTCVAVSYMFASPVPKATGPSAYVWLSSDAVVLGDPVVLAATLDPGPKPGLTLKNELDSLGRGLSIRSHRTDGGGDKEGLKSILSRNQRFLTMACNAPRKRTYTTPQTVYFKLQTGPDGRKLSEPGECKFSVTVPAVGGLASPEAAVRLVAETPEYARFCGSHAAAIRDLADRGVWPVDADRLGDEDKVFLRAAAHSRRVRRMQKALHDLATLDGRGQPAAMAEVAAIRAGLTGWVRDHWDLEVAEVYEGRQEYAAAVRILKGIEADGPEKEDILSSSESKAEEIRKWRAKMIENE